MRDWQIECVCGGTDDTCNNGWMRRLEETVALILPTLMRGESTRLSEADQKLIATWAILKVMVVNHRMVHHLQRRQMKNKRVLPSGWGVWLADFERKSLPAEWMSRPFSMLPNHIWAKRKSLDRNPNSHATTQIFKRLLIHVVYTPKRDFVSQWKFPGPNRAPLSGQIVRIWPPIGHSIVWPRKALSDSDAMAVADAILSGVMEIARSLGLLRTP